MCAHMMYTCVHTCARTHTCAHTHAHTQTHAHAHQLSGHCNFKKHFGRSGNPSTLRVVRMSPNFILLTFCNTINLTAQSIWHFISQQ